MTEGGRWVSMGGKCVGVGVWVRGGPGSWSRLSTVIIVSTHIFTCMAAKLDVSERQIGKCAYVWVVALVHVIQSRFLLQPSCSLQLLCAVWTSKITPIHLATVTYWLCAEGEAIVSSAVLLSFLFHLSVWGHKFDKAMLKIPVVFFLIQFCTFKLVGILSKSQTIAWIHASCEQAGKKRQKGERVQRQQESWDTPLVSMSTQ